MVRSIRRAVQLANGAGMASPGPYETCYYGQDPSHACKLHNHDTRPHDPSHASRPRRRGDRMRRREVIALIGGVAGWPRAGRAQQHSWGKIGYLSGRSLEPELPILTPFRNGLAEAGHVEGRNA